MRDDDHPARLASLAVVPSTYYTACAELCQKSRYAATFLAVHFAAWHGVIFYLQPQLYSLTQSLPQLLVSKIKEKKSKQKILPIPLSLTLSS